MRGWTRKRIENHFNSAGAVVHEIERDECLYYLEEICSTVQTQKLYKLDLQRVIDGTFWKRIADRNERLTRLGQRDMAGGYLKYGNIMESFLHWLLESLQIGVVPKEYEKKKVPNREYCSIIEAADILGVTKRRVEQMIDEGPLKVLKKNTGRLIMVNSLRDYIRNSEK